MTTGAEGWGGIQIMLEFVWSAEAADDMGYPPNRIIPFFGLLILIVAALWGMISSWRVAAILSWELFSNYVVILTHEEDYEEEDDNIEDDDNLYDNYDDVQ